MGCNMHTHIEVKKDGKWYHFAAPLVERDYALFTMIAGQGLNRAPFDMTGESGVASTYRLPDDVSEVTRECYAQDNDRFSIHDVRVLDAYETEQLQLKLNEHCNPLEKNGKGCDLERDIFRTYVNSNAISAHDGWNDVRIVCWFDN